MKKLIVILTVAILIVGMAVSAYAQSAPEAEIGTRSTPNENATPHDALGDDVIHDEPRLADGVQGKGTIENPVEYWKANGFPENVSFACEGGSENDNGINIVYWIVGLVNSDDRSKQEIIDLISPNSRITFMNCAYSYNQREEAFNEIYASRNDIVLAVQMVLNSEAVLVEIADGYEKEYARKYVEQYGAFVVVTNDITAANDAMSLGGLDVGIGNTKNGFNLWLWTVGGILLLGTAAILLANRTRLIPAMQTTSGNVVTGNAPVSKKQTIAAVKNSAITPSEDVFHSIMERIEKAQK